MINRHALFYLVIRFQQTLLQLFDGMATRRIRQRTCRHLFLYPTDILLQFLHRFIVVKQRNDILQYGLS